MMLKPRNTQSDLWRPSLALLPVLWLALTLGPHGHAQSPPPEKTATSPSSQDAPSLSQEERDARARTNFDTAFKILLERHVSTDLTVEDLYQAAIMGMLYHVSPALNSERARPDKSPDPSNRWMSRKHQQRFNKFLSGKGKGMGIFLEPNTAQGAIEILGVMDDSPAQKAGLKKADLIVAVNGKPLEGLKASAMFKSLKPDTLQLGVTRAGEHLALTLVKEPIVLDAITAEILPPDLGLVRIHMFADQTPSQLKDVLEQFKSHKLKGLIVDLRSTRIGRLDVALQVLDLLVRPDLLLVTLEDRAGKKKPYYSHGEPVLNVPMAVLVDYMTSSSAEVVALALQEQMDAPIVGQPTYGKATAEEVFPLPDGSAVLVSTMTLYSPKGHPWEAEGITPDVVLKEDDAGLRKSYYATTVEERLKLDRSLAEAVRQLTR